MSANKSAVFILKTKEELRGLVRDMQESLDEETISDAGFGFDAATKAWKERIEAILPSPTMAEIEWDDTQHHLAEAIVTEVEFDKNFSDTVIMLSVSNFGNIWSLDPTTREMSSLSPGRLTPTGRKHRLELEGGEEISGSAEQEHGEAPCLLDKDGDHWVKVDGQWHMVDPDFAYDELPELYGPYRPFSKSH